MEQKSTDNNDQQNQNTSSTDKVEPETEAQLATRLRKEKADAAAFVGVKVKDVFHYVKKGERFAVVTVDGKKLTETPDERTARLRKEEAARERAKKKAEQQG